MGVRGGHITWHGASGEKRPDWARELALGRCNATTPNCVVVAANGDAQLDALRELAGRLGAKPQADVREEFLKSLRRHLP
jgi:hypothetical protein